MQILDQAQIDAFSEQFEEHRAQGNSGPESIKQFLQSVGVCAANCSPLLCELIQIDAQYSWMAWEKLLSRNFDQLNVKDVLDQFEKLPRFESYLPLVIDSADASQILPALAEREAKDRDEWGDAIGCVYFALKHGLQIPANRQHAPNLLRCDLDGSTHGHSSAGFRLRGRTLVGRQRSTDNEESFCEQLMDGNRIVVANRFEAKISREQLAVQLLTPAHAAITNLSAINPVVLAAGDVIAPGESMLVKFPFVVRLPGRRLLFYKSDQS